MLLRKPRAGDHSRQRVFDLTRTFWCWLWQVLQSNASCREVVRQTQALFSLRGHKPPDESTSAYCQARAKFSLTLLQKIFAATVQSAEKGAPASSLLQGRNLKLVDGSIVRLQDTRLNRAAFPLSPNQFSRPGFPLMKIVALFSLRSGALLAHATSALQVVDARLLMGLRTQLQANDILVADRAYGLYVLIQWLNGLSVDSVVRLNARSRAVDFRKASKLLGPGDALFLWLKPKVASKLLSLQAWAQVSEAITVRVIHTRIQRPGFRTRDLTLASSLLDATLYPAEEILQAYCKRWRLEMCFDDLKTTLGMEMLSCKSPHLVQKELLVFLTAHNFIRWLMVQAAQTEAVDLQRMSFKGSLDAFRQWTLALSQIRGPASKSKRHRLWLALIKTVAGDLILNRPGRHEPRAVKKRNKYPRLTQCRHIYIDRWSRNKRRRVARAKKRTS